jgi:hypothetical protein
MKPQHRYFTGGGYTCEYHPKTKIPTKICISLLKSNTVSLPEYMQLSQQPSFKGRKRVAINETHK